MTVEEVSVPRTRRRVVALPARPAGERFPARRNRGTRARPVSRRPSGDLSSPTMPIGRVLLTVVVAFLVAIVFSARGIEHAGTGMADGPERTLTLALGGPLLSVAETVHLTWPWDRLESALGRVQQPAVAPLLASSVAGKGLRHAGPAGGTIVPPLRHQRPNRPLASSAGTIRPRPRVPTAANPLRLLVTGDSLTEFLGPQLVDAASRLGPLRGYTDTHYGTGLVRPDFVDWSVVARQQVAADHPDAIVVMIGGNDFQNMTMPGGRIIDALTPAWTREYQRRAEICMRIWAQGGRARVYWLSMPPARSSAWTLNNQNINLALRRAAKTVLGVSYVNVLRPITNHGRYADFVDVNGQPVLVRAPDGIHLSEAGSNIVAGEVLKIIKRYWHL